MAWLVVAIQRRSRSRASGRKRMPGDGDEVGAAARTRRGRGDVAKDARVLVDERTDLGDPADDERHDAVDRVIGKADASRSERRGERVGVRRESSHGGGQA
jgi:hypothetical protein